MKKLVLASALALASSMANAGTVTMSGGVTLDEVPTGDLTAAAGNFNNSFNFIQWWDNSTTAGVADSLSTLTLANAGDFTLNGIGKIETVDLMGKLNCSGCELTFEFGGLGVEFSDVMNPAAANAYTVVNGFPPADIATLDAWLTLVNSPQPATVKAPSLVLGGGYLNVYLDYAPDANIIPLSNAVSTGYELTNADVATFTNGNATPWLTASFDQVTFNEDDVTDGVFGLSKADTWFGLTVTGGTAQDNFKTDVISDEANGIMDLTDVLGLGLSATFGETGGVFNKFAQGSTAGTITGVAIPEPSTLAILGLGLLGFAGAARRKQAK